MTDENAKRKYAHLKGLIEGKLKTGNPVRDDLIVSDAKKHLADLIKKRPNINFEEKTIVIDEPKPKTNSKSKVK